MAAQQQPAKLNPAQINQIARAAIRAQAVKMCQQIYAQSGLQNSTQVSVPARNVGLILGFWVKVVLTVANANGAPQLDLTDFGPSNALSNIQFQDLDNNTRVNTPGWHLHLVNTIKQRRVFGTAFVRGTGFDSPINYGSLGINQISAPATIAPNTNGTVTMWYWVPLAYSEDDLRGCVYGNVVNATMQLLLSLPGSNGVQLAVANGSDSTLALYVGHAAGAINASLSNVAITVYQVYYDQLPRDPNLGLLLPITDLATVYELKQTSLTGITVNQPFNYQYSNFRDFLSTVAVYNNNPATNGGRQSGQDVTTWALQSANFTNIFQEEPGLAFLQTRNECGVDFPPGVYYFSHRRKPISTTQYGNMQLVLTPSVANAGAYMLVGVEDFGLVQKLSMAGSLAAS